MINWPKWLKKVFTRKTFYLQQTAIIVINLKLYRLRLILQTKNQKDRPRFID